jgi:oxygen-independent coproporphyrinogen-3 oxidase
MKLICSDNISKYYLQSLCLLYFPGSKFSENEKVTEETPVVTVTLTESEGSVCAKAQFKIGEQIAESEVVEKYKTTAASTAIRIQKIAVGKAVFSAGQKMFGYTPSWGILTGIRPSKISRQIYAQTGDPAKTRKILRDEYFLYPKKAALLTNITVNESKIVERMGKKSCSLYISIPFCPTRCAYCSFVSFATKRLLSLIPEYIDRVLRDLDIVFHAIARNGLKLSTIYIGGGTPTTLSADQLLRIFGKIEEYVDPFSLEEFTLEAGRPDTITQEKLNAAVLHGVTRISINPQTLNEAVLQGIGRFHTISQFYESFDLARKSGVKYINTDLIVGLPGDSYRSFSKTMDSIIKLEPDNITVHTFCVKKAADLAHSEGIYTNAGGDVQKSVDYSQLRAKSGGYIPYYLYRQKNSAGNLENVGFSKPGAEGLYNIYIMEELQTIFSVGAGAVTKLVDRENNRIERIFMDKYPYEYLSEDAEKKFKSEYPDNIDRFFSVIFNE